MLLEGQPELSYALIALSLTLPYVEPWLIRTMSLAKHQVTDAELVEEMVKFNGQEGQHSRLHARFNKAVRESCPELEALEAELAADFHRFTTARSLKWNLAYAEGFEAFTGALARFLFEEQLLRGADPAVRDLFEWHMVEEMEHRCVAFDVYEHVVGSYLYRVAVGSYAQWHLLRFLTRAMEAMLAADPRTEAEFGGKAGRKAREVRLRTMLTKKIWPRLRRTHSSSYTPQALEMPASMAALAEQYTARSRPVS